MEVSAATTKSLSKIDQDPKAKNTSLKAIVVNFSKHPLAGGNGGVVGKKDQSRRSPGNDVVSKNITMVLENLLKNYESSQLPTHGKGG